MVPKGWHILPLGELAEFRNGLNFSKDDDGEEIKVITIPDFWKRTVLRSFEDVKTIKVKGSVPKTSLLESGDLVFVRSNGNPELVGRCLFFPEVSEKMSFSGFTIRGRTDASRLLPEFAAPVMLTDRTKYQFRRGRGGGNISNLSQDILSGVQVALPPLPEQRKIAEILGAWDRAIEVAEAQLAAAKTQKRSLMQQLLTGQRRFPEFEGQPWKEVRLGDISRSWSGGTPSRSRPEFYGGNVAWIKSGEVNSAIVLKTSETITEKALKNSSASMVEKGNILIAMYGATAGVVSVAGIRAAINQAILAVEPIENVNASFLHRSIEFSMDKTKRLTQGGQPNLNAGIIRSTKIGIPSQEEQKKIADVLSSTQLVISQKQTSLKHLRTEKKALMQQLLTGKRRVLV